MKVLIISNMYPHPCSPYYGSFVRDQANSLSAHGVECIVVASTEYRKGVQYTIPKYLILLFRVLKAILIHKFDIIHAHYAFPTGLIAYMASIVNRSAWIITTHGSDIHNVKPGTRSLLAFVLRNADHIIAVGEHMKTDLCNNFGISPTQISVVDMGVDTHLFRPIPKYVARQKLDLPQSATIFLFVGRLIWLKGVNYLLHAIADLSLSDRDVLLILVGDGPQATEFKELTTALDINSRVMFVGAVAKANLPLWLSSGDCLVHPTLKEAFGLAVVEAMSCQKIVIASAVGGILEFIIDGENGFLVEPENSKALTEKIEYVMTLPIKEIERVQNAARASAMAHDTSVQTVKVNQIYHQIIGVCE